MANNESPELMTDKEYAQTQKDLIFMGRMVRRMANLDLFLQRTSRAHTLGPILDPTLYKKGRSNMEIFEALAKELQHFQKAVVNIGNLVEKE